MFACRRRNRALFSLRETVTLICLCLLIRVGPSRWHSTTCHGVQETATFIRVEREEKRREEMYVILPLPRNGHGGVGGWLFLSAPILGLSFLRCPTPQSTSTMILNQISKTPHTKENDLSIYLSSYICMENIFRNSNYNENICWLLLKQKSCLGSRITFQLILYLVIFFLLRLVYLVF